MNKIQEILAQLMEQGWAEVEIAAHLGVGQATVARWRRGERVPYLERVLIGELTRMLERGKAPASTG
jgi:transcriptional regulator with XRE-family HTH domain